MILKDKYANQIQVYQDKTGSIQLLFGNNSIRLDLWQVEKLVGGYLYDIDDFDKDLFLKAYLIKKNNYGKI